MDKAALALLVIGYRVPYLAGVTDKKISLG